MLFLLCCIRFLEQCSWPYPTHNRQTDRQTDILAVSKTGWNTATTHSYNVHRAMIQFVVAATHDIRHNTPLQKAN